MNNALLLADLLILAKDMIVELSRREKVAGIKPDEDLDIFMKVTERQLFFFFPLK